MPPPALLLLAASLSQAPSTELPFELVGGRIYVAAELNGSAASALLDTGAGATVMEIELAQRLELATGGDLNARGTGGATVKGKILRDARLRLGEVVEPVKYALPFGPLAGREGRPLEVVVGYPFFAAHVVDIDYAARRLRIFDADAEVGAKGAVLPIRFVDNHPHATVRMKVGDEVYELDAMVDSGASGTTLSGKFLAAHPLDVRATAKAVVMAGVGGDVEGRLFRPDAIEIGSLRFAKPVVVMAETASGEQGTDSDYDVLLGADLLRRCRVVVDYPRTRFAFEAGPDFAKPFEADKSGLRLVARGADLRTFEVAGVLPGSSAAEAGIAVGDVIETIDGAPASKLTLQQLRERFRVADAKRWQLGIRRGGEVLSIELVARSIV
jgi:predicted aspartyl protease